MIEEIFISAFIRGRKIQLIKSKDWLTPRVFVPPYILAKAVLDDLVVKLLHVKLPAKE